MDTNTNIGYKNISVYLNSTGKIVAFTAILYFLFAKLSQSIFISEINLPPFFPAIGFGTAIAIIFGRKAILGVAIGGFLFSISIFQNQLLNPISFHQFVIFLCICLLRSLIASLNTFLVFYFTQLWCKTKYPFNNSLHVLYFATSCLLGSVIASSVCIPFLSEGTFFSTDGLLLMWSNLIRANTLSIIVFAPFVLSWLHKEENNTKWSLLKKTEALILSVISITLSIYVFSSQTHNESILYLLLIWVAYRFGNRLITTTTLIIAIISIYFTSKKIGGFAFSDWNNDYFMLQLFLFVNMVSILFLKAILKEKENEETRLKISEQNLSLERNILKATIESTNGVSIFSLDTNLNYLSFNSVHENFMKNQHEASIKIGDNHIELISSEDKKKEFTSIYHNVLKGDNYTKEEKNTENIHSKIFKSPIRDKKNEIIGVTVIVTNITELKLKEIQLKKNNNSLNERIKELHCLFNITKILNNKILSKSEKLQACVQIIPAALQFPETAYSRIQFEGEEFLSDNYQKNDFQITQKIIINGEEFGCIEMGYFNAEKMKMDTIFLEEEIQLLETLSDIISKALETKIAEEKLTKSEESYRILFENIQDVFFKTSIKTKEILDVSPSCSTFNGITREELIGQNMSSIYSNKDKAQLMFQQIMTEHKVVDYNSEITIKGKSFYVSINAKIIFDSNGEPEFAIGSLRDITKRKLAEKNLKLSEEKFRSIYENFEDIYFRTSMTGTILDVSPSFEKHFKKPCSEALGGTVYDFYYDEKDRELFISKLKDQKQVNDFDVRFKDNEGNIIFLSFNARIIYDENGNSMYIEGSMRNINDRIAIQKEVIAKKRQLEFQNIELEQFAYIASHDLQEPLITVMHCISLLQDELCEILDEDQKQYLEFILSSTSRMQMLIKGLLDYSKIGKERINETIDCNEIVSTVLSDMTVSLKESNAIVEYNNLPIIQGSPTEMRQLFQNMISNANKFQRKGQQPKIKIAATKESDNWLFSIQDNGIGIKEQDIDKAFIIFKRLNNRDEYKGTGIGLSHCKKIIEHHGGKIWVESKFNEGTTFKWTFPIKQSSN